MHPGKCAPHVGLPGVELRGAIDDDAVVALDLPPVAQPAQVEEVGRDLGEARQLAPLGPGQGHAVPRQQLGGLGPVPRAIPELDREPRRRGRGGEEPVEQADRAFVTDELGRHLDQERAELVPERLERLHELGHVLAHP
ncbi:MAG TPA: hypothetical protein VI792_06540 [Candidatus Eisenbacteria bacterium]